MNAKEPAIVGGHLALDLANTIAPRPPAPVEDDYLPDPPALLRWARRAGVVSEEEAASVERAWQPAGVADAALADALELRTLVDEVLAGRRLDVLARRWADAMTRSMLIAHPDGRGASLAVGTDPARMIGDRLADAIVALLRDADLTRLHTCPIDEGGCGWIFLDRSRNQSRKWCTMDDCGTHAKSRRLTERRRRSR